MKTTNKEIMNNEKDRFYILERVKSVRKLPKSSKVKATSITKDDIELLLPYLRVKKYLNPDRGFNRIISEAVNLCPDKLSPFLKKLEKEKEAINERISDDLINKFNYNSFCFSLIRIILTKDKYRITYIDPDQFEDNVFGMIHQKLNCIRPAEVPEGTTFVAKRNKKKILFCFDEQDPPLLKEVANIVKDSDKNEYNTICVMIVRDTAEMKNRRGFSKADRWPRGFFMCYEEFQGKAEKINPKKYSKLYTRAPIPQAPKRTPILSAIAEVKENIPVGKIKNHYKLRFKSIHSFNIMPGQFIMIDTLPQGQDNIIDPIDLIEPTPYLKRPFGIHRAFYRHFSEDEDRAYSKTSSIAYLKKMSLPPELATVLHTVFPNKFEIFYKVLPNGIGTKKLSELEIGDRIQILGPLGNGAIIRELREKGFDEIHLIGGGVGMAPLIFIVQALRYYSYKVKAFIGIEKLEMLRYKRTLDPLDETFKEEDPTIYIDDLLDTGLDDSDIYVSNTEADTICKGIPKDNLYNGFVSDQYEDYLLHVKPSKNILTFACGPSDMMKALVPIANKYGMPLKVLMEKRMACGIGVCLSCVCETKTKTGEEKYSRVCTDGPIFDSSEVIWK